MSQLDLPLFPLNVVLFPGMPLPLHVFEDRYKLMIGACMVTDRTFGVALIQSGPEVGGPATIHPIGTTARIIEVERLPEGRMNLIAVGVNRFRLVERLDDRPYAVGRVELLPDRVDGVAASLTDRVISQFRRFLQGRGLPAAKAGTVRIPNEPLALSYVVAAALRVPTRERQRLLESESVDRRLRRELAILEFEVGGPDGVNARSFSLN